MSVHTKTRHTRRRPSISEPTKLKKEKSIPADEALAFHFEKYTKPGVMLRGHRFKRELTQKELGEQLKISQNHLSEMETGKRPIGKSMAKRFADFFETDYRRFL